MATTTTARKCALSLGLLLAGCGDPGTLPRCKETAECDSGLVCLSPVGGGNGVCGSPPFGVAMIEPAPGASVGGAGATVTVQVTTASPGASPPGTVLMAVNGEVESSLAPAGRDGSILTYQGKYVPKAGTLQNVKLWVWVTTPAGLVPSNAVVLVVDAKAPHLADPLVYCSLPCTRDEPLTVNAWAEDDHAISLEASLDLDGHANPVPLPATGSPHSYAAKIALKDRPFPKFSGFASVRVRARDTFGNESVVDARPVEVTRLRWAYDAKAPITSPAIAADGTAVIGISAALDQLRAVYADGFESWRTTLARTGAAGGSFARSAPSIGPSAIWAGSDDGNLYGRKPDGSLVTCPATGQGTPGSLFTPAIRLDPAEVAYSGGSAKYLYGGTADPDGCLPASPASTVDAVTTSPVIAGGKVFVVTAKAGASTLRRFADDGTGEASLPTSCGTVVAPPAADGNGDVLLACGTGEIERANRSTLATTALATLPDLAAESIVILPGGDLVVGTNDGKVHRLAPPASGGTVAWTDAWNPPPDLGAAVTGVLVAAPDAAGQGAVVYAVTESGDLHALDAQGATVWTTAGSLGNFSLRFPTIAPALPGRLPTLYAGSAEGKLYAVVADTGLDTLSPWPKSHHDIRNTGNASAPLP